jgi:hypothetical protein
VQNKFKIALNGRVLLRRPRHYQNCSAIEEEEAVSIPNYFFWGGDKIKHSNYAKTKILFK